MLITADDICAGAEAVLTSGRLREIVELAGWEELRKIKDWHQVPSLDALSEANLPTGAITSPGLTDSPVGRHGNYAATWRVVVGVYDRGASYKDTARRTRRWAAVIRAALLESPTLGGVASGVRWVGEEYAERPNKNQARTIGGCAVAFDVDASNVVDLTPYSVAPVVTATQTTVSVR